MNSSSMGFVASETPVAGGSVVLNTVVIEESSGCHLLRASVEVRAAACGTHLDVGVELLASASPVLRRVSKDVPLSGLWGRGQRFPAGHRSLLPGVATARTHYFVLTRSLGVFTRSLCCHALVLSGAWSRCSAGCFRAPMLRHQRHKLRSWFL